MIPGPLTEAEVYSPETVAELHRIRDVIIEQGWAQGDLRTDRAVCLLGGMYLAVPQARREHAIRWVLTRYLTETHPGFGSIPAYNDQPGRTVHDILAFLDGAATWVKEKIND